MAFLIDQLAVLNLATVGNSITAGSFVRSGGTSSQFLKADGTIDSTTYTPTNGTGASGTWGISITGNAATVGGLPASAFLRLNTWEGSVRVETGGIIYCSGIYDTNNSSFVLDPSGQSNLLALSSQTLGRFGNSIYYINRVDIVNDGGYWVGTQGWGNTIPTWNNSVFSYGSGFTEIWGSNTNHPEGSGYIHAQGLQVLHYRSGNFAYGWQIVGGNAGNGRIYVRGVWGTGFNGWYEILTSNNYFNFNSNFPNLFTNGWYYTQGTGGLFFNGYGYGIAPAGTVSFYGNIVTTPSGANNWAGYVIRDTNGYLTAFMGQNGDVGWYSQTFSFWLLYYNRNNNCLTIGSSASSSSYRLWVTGNTQVDGNLFVNLNVGIGTSSISNRLEVNGNVNVGSTNFYRYNGDTGLMGSGTSITGGTATQLGIRAANDILFATNGANERMRITSGGNILIGTTTDAGQKLQVSGTANATQFNSTSGTVSVAPATPTTFFTPTTVGLYMAHVYLAGNATQTWDAVIIFAYNTTDILVVNQTNSTNVFPSVSGTNIQVYQVGATTYTFNYEIIKIA